jgi:hypothetical protein
MKRTTKKIVLVTVLAVPMLLVFADEYPALRFRGDGQISGGPVFGYWIRLESIPFARPGEYTFHFRGMPREEMSLQLYTQGEYDRSALTNLNTQHSTRNNFIRPARPVAVLGFRDYKIFGDVRSSPVRQGKRELYRAGPVAVDRVSSLKADLHDRS